jgi:excisionase family DNA binding protein
VRLFHRSKNFRSFSGIIYIDNKIFLVPKVATSKGTAAFFVALNLKIYGGVTTMETFNGYITVKQASELLGISVWGVYWRITNHHIPTIQIGRNKLIKQTDLEK